MTNFKFFDKTNAQDLVPYVGKMALFSNHENAFKSDSMYLVNNCHIDVLNNVFIDDECPFQSVKMHCKNTITQEQLSSIKRRKTYTTKWKYCVPTSMLENQLRGKTQLRDATHPIICCPDYPDYPENL